MKTNKKESFLKLLLEKEVITNQNKEKKDTTLILNKIDNNKDKNKNNNKDNKEDNKEDNTDNTTIKLKQNLVINLNNLNIEITNETIGEILSIIPYITSSFEHFIIYNGNIIADIEKTYFSLYDSYKELKLKWKEMEFLKQKNQEENESFEMLFLKANYKAVKEVLE